MDARFLPHNCHWHSPEKFDILDPNLVTLTATPLVHTPAILQQLPQDIPGIYIVTGGRQIGKTTMLKQWMSQLLHRGQPPTAIAYISGEMIGDSHALLAVVASLQEEMATDGLHFLIVDEITYIRDWDRAVKFLADSGQLARTMLLLTGSDTVLIQQAKSRFPGRRGCADQVDFHMYPLSFREVVKLKHGEGSDSPSNTVALLRSELLCYLEHGGYLTAINDIVRHQRILPATFRTYADWIRGDMLKQGRQEHYLREILAAIIKRYGSQVSWNALARDLSIDHPKTVADYIALLTSMDALFVQYALLMDRLAPAPKKARKVSFTDPFILHAVRAWLGNGADPYPTMVRPLIADPAWRGKLVESVVSAHFSRLYPTYYIKTAKGEIDVAAVIDGSAKAIEVKWTTQLTTQDVKMVCSVANGQIWADVPERYEINKTAVIPLPLALFDLGA